MLLAITAARSSSCTSALLTVLSVVSTAAENTDEDGYTDLDGDEFDGDGDMGAKAMHADLRSIMLIVGAVFICVVAFIVLVIEKFANAPRKRFRLKKRGKPAPLWSLVGGTRIKTM